MGREQASPQGPPPPTLPPPRLAWASGEGEFGGQLDVYPRGRGQHRAQKRRTLGRAGTWQHMRLTPPKDATFWEESFQAEFRP